MTRRQSIREQIEAQAGKRWADMVLGEGEFPRQRRGHGDILLATRPQNLNRKAKDGPA